MLHPVNNNDIAFKSGPWYANALTYMSRPDSWGPIFALEGTVDVGRATNAYKRGGKNEMRERIIEDLTGAAVWLFGVRILNNLGDKILKKKYGDNFDVYQNDILRTPFDNFLKKNADKSFAKKPTRVALAKGAKVLTSVLLADAFIGLVVPKFNQALTRKMIAKDKKKTKDTDRINIQTDGQKNVTFKSSKGLVALTTFTNAIENTNVGKLLSTDAGLVSGRMYSARNNDERREIAIRDIGSMYFFYWAIGHVGKLLNKLESGHFTRLNPDSANILNENLLKLIEENGGEMTVDAFMKSALGLNSSDIKLPADINFETEKMSSFTKFFNKNKEPLQVVKVSDLEGKFSAEELERIKQMSKLQPLRKGEAVVTKQQIIDALNPSRINNADLLGNIFSQFTGGEGKIIGTKNGKPVRSKVEFSGGDYINEFKYISNDKLYDLKAELETYVKDLCKNVKDGKITKDVLNKAKNKNILMNGLNFIAGFVFAAAFLANFIPKLQYWVTKQKTGKDSFPGTYEFEENNKSQVK